MLVFGRRVGEEVIIDNRILIKVLRIFKYECECEINGSMVIWAPYEKMITLEPGIGMMLVSTGSCIARLGFDAPRDIKINRKEIDEQDKNECARN